MADRRVYLPGKSFGRRKLDHPAVGRVCEQFGPVGPEGARQLVATYEYNFTEDRHRHPEQWSGWTEVWDANRHRTTYHFSADHRLTKIDRYENSNGRLSSEYYNYASERPYLGNLMSKVLCDEDDHPLMAVTLEYDDRGNVIVERLWGDLTGESSSPLLMDGSSMPIENGVQVCEKRYLYPKEEEDNRRLAAIDGTRRTEYQYWEKTDLVSGRLILDGDRIVERHFYQYNADGAVTEYSWDNGHNRKPSDLSGVTCRRIRRVKPVVSGHAIGLPERVEEWYWEGKDHFLGAVEYVYNRRNFIVEERVFDSHGKCRYVLHTEWDDGGRPLRRTDPEEGEVRYQYDANGNLLSQIGPRPGCGVRHEYDQANRRITTSLVGPNGECHTTSFRYDGTSNCVEKTDYLGNCVEMEFGALGRLLVKRMPSIRGGNPPEWHYRYDAAGRIISEIDPLGEEVQRRYNGRGQVVEERFADGTTQSCIYNLRGLPIRRRSRKEVVTEAKYDGMDRVVQLSIYSANGELVRQLSFDYDGDRIVKTCDGEGNERFYNYDGGGRLVQERCGDQRIEYQYDSLGRPCCKTIHLSSGVREEWTDRDLLGRIVEERIGDGTGRVLQKIRYQYDEVGNRTRVETFGAKGRSHIQHTEYDCFNRPVCTIDAMGNETWTEHATTTNQLGQRVEQKIVVNPIEERAITTYDALGNPVRLEQLDPFGKTLSDVETVYDAVGRVVEERTAVIPAAKGLKSHVVQFHRGPMGRVERVVEGRSCTAEYTYNRLGQIVAKGLASGEGVAYTYDGLGRLVEESGPGYLYTYGYDCNDNIVQVKDGEGRITERLYDKNNWLVAERQGSGLSIGYKRDRAGRPVQATLPDKSAILFAYDAANLSSVGRTDSTGEQLYSHQYAERDLSGRILREQLIGEIGEVVRAWNERGGLVRSSGPALTEQIAYDPLGRLSARNGESFRYDGLSQIQEGKNLFNSLGNRHWVSELNRLKRKEYRHDRQGCLEETAERSCRFDGRGRLIEASVGGVVYRYVYDAFDRRIEEWRGEERVCFLYDGGVEVAMVRGGRMEQVRLLGEGITSDIGAMVAVELDGRPFAVRSDYRGCVAALIDLSGEVVEEYTYGPFGEERGGDLSPWRFSSKRVDPTGLIYFGARHYDPHLGRWISPDPLGFTAGPNLYVYCGNDPLNCLDPDGRFYDTILALPILGPYHQSIGSHLAGMAAYGSMCDLPYSEFRPVTYLDDFEDHYVNKSCRYSLREMEPEQKYREFANGQLMYVNGMDTQFDCAVGNANYLSRLAGGCNVHGVWNATHGHNCDLTECSLNLYRYLATPPVRKIHEAWDEFFAGSDPDQLMYVVCHSQGAIHVRNALLDYDDERRKRIIVLAVAPGAYIDPSICGHVTHLVSHPDPVPHMDYEGRVRCARHIIHVERHPSACRWNDHSFRSRSYEREIINWMQLWTGSGS